MSAMAIVKLVLQIVLVIFSLLLTLLILMHKGKGGGLSDMLDRHYRVAVGGHHHRPRFDDEVQPHLKRLHGFGP